MKSEIIEACNNRNLKQAKRVINHFRDLGFVGMGESGSAFSITCLNSIYNKEHTDNELFEISTDGDGDDFIDAIVFTKHSVDIFDFKFEDNIKAAQLQNLESSIKRNFLSGAVADFSNCKRLKMQLKKYHSRKNISKMNIYIVRKNIASIGEKEKVIIDRMSRLGSSIDVQILSQEEISKKMLELDFLQSWILLKRSSKELDREEDNLRKDHLTSLILKVSVFSLLTLYRDHLEQDKNLFASNIRAPRKLVKFANGLQDNINNRAKDFHLFHNGLVITAENVSEDLNNFHINNPQVVNGAQTLGNLYEKYKLDLGNIKLKQSFIICKIIKADENLTNDICEAANSQKAIKTEDLRTNDSFQKELEIYIKNASNDKYLYIRKPGEKVERGLIKIPYVKFFQWAYAALLLQPAKAKNAKQLLFETDSRGEYNNIKEEINNNIGTVIRLCRIGIFVEKEIPLNFDKTEKGLIRDMNLHIIAGLFYFRNDDFNKNFKKVFRLLKSYMKVRRAQDPLITNGQIFAQSDLAWEFLKSKI